MTLLKGFLKYRPFTLFLLVFYLVLLSVIFYIQSIVYVLMDGVNVLSFSLFYYETWLESKLNIRNKR